MNMITYEQYLELLQNRRSMRAFTDQQVSEEQIDKIIQAACYAPSGMNYQPWEFIVVKDKEVIKQLTFLSFEGMKMPPSATTNMKMPKQMKLANNPSILIVLVGDRRKNINLPGQSYDFSDGKLSLQKPLGIVDVESIYNTSMANAFLQMVTAATTLGLGAQYVTMMTSVAKEKEVRETLNIPEYMDVFDVAAIGYPAYSPRKKYVKPKESSIHYGTYDQGKSMTSEVIVERARTHEDYKFLD